MERRNLLKAIGASGLTLGSFSSVTSANGNYTSQVKELNKSEVRNAFAMAQQTEPVGEMGEFLKDKTGTEMRSGNFSGVRVTPSNAIDHVVLQATFENPQSNDHVKLSIRVFEDTATASVTLDGTGYKANPETVHSSINTDTINQNIVTAETWAQSTVDQDSVETLSDCDTKGTFDVGGPACDFISGLALLSGTIMGIFPEPSSSLAGTVLVSGVLGGNCQIADAIDEALDDTCNFTEITVCVNYNCRLDPTVGTWCEPAIKVWPDC